jgi:nucleoside-diphosphate-sugar epimerase
MSKEKVMRVLVTGCAGFIGSNLTARCVKEGWDVTGVDDLSNGQVDFLPKGFHFLKDDFASGEVLSAIRSGGFDVVFHLAAVPRVSYSVEHPVETHETNVYKTLQLMDACRGNVKRIVFASSSSVYGGADELPTRESNPKNPKSPYALQKSIIEDYLKLYRDLYGLDSVCLRFFNVFGPNQLGDSPYSTAVSAWLTSIKRGQSMRSDGDGSQSRDMCYVDNVVDACVKSATRADPLNAECYNVACGERTTNKDILAYLKKKYPDAVHHDAPWRPGDVMHTQADLVKIHSDLGYVPLVKIWEGIDRTIEWIDSNWDSINKMRLSK